MKSKSIFIVVLFSLLLNIGHDFLMTQQIEKHSSVSSVELVSEKSSQHLDTFHHFFHFVAIITFRDWIEEKVVTKRAFLSQKLPLFIAYKNSFKPPKA